MAAAAGGGGPPPLSRVRVVAGPEGDAGRSRVRLRPCVWQALGLGRFGDPVVVSLPGGQRLVGTAWPLHPACAPGPAAEPHEPCQLDPSILLPEESAAATLDGSPVPVEVAVPGELLLASFRCPPKAVAMRSVRFLVRASPRTASDPAGQGAGDGLFRGRRRVLEVTASDPPSSPDTLLMLGTATVVEFDVVRAAAVVATPTPGGDSGTDTEANRVFAALCTLVRLPTTHAHIFEGLALECPKGILLHGPPGVGKTFVVGRVAQSCNAHLISVRGPECLSAYMGDSERNLRRVFADALAVAAVRPCILFIDEIDALCPKRSEHATHEARVVAQLLTLMDGLESRGKLIIIAATNRPNSLDPALRRPGRFDREVQIRPPTGEQRAHVLKAQCRAVPLAPQVNLQGLAHRCIGFVGADLAALVRQASMNAIGRHIAKVEDQSGGLGGSSEPTQQVSVQDFEMALAQVQPSTRRAWEVRVDATHWADVGGLDHVKLELQQAVEWPLKYPGTFQRLGIAPTRGVLLYGPPGCSKTTLVKVIATMCSATFLSVNGAQLYSPYVGDAERTIRETFRQARLAAPAILFLDEVDALVGRRTDSAGDATSVQARVLSTLLNEMDGVEQAGRILVVAATNRPDMLDAAFLRPGRMDKVLYVPPPDARAREDILRVLTRTIPVAADVDLAELVPLTEHYSGADLQSLCREAAIRALREDLRGCRSVERRHFHAALGDVTPSITEEMLGFYRQYRDSRNQRQGAGP